MPDMDLTARFEAYLPDVFAKTLLMGALAALTQENVATRAQHFSVSMRELTTYLLEHLTPENAAIETCSWYKQDENTIGPTRRQRCLFASRGGLPDRFLKGELDLDPKEFHREFGPAFQKLNKLTHLRPDTVITDPAEIEDFANETLGALIEIFDTITDVRGRIVAKLERRMQEEAIDAFINQTIDSLDLIAGQYETGMVLTDEMRVVDIGADTVVYEITGTVGVTLHYGSKHDAASIEQTFPFTCKSAASAHAPLSLLDEQTSMEVDTSDWYGEIDEGDHDVECAYAPPAMDDY